MKGRLIYYLIINPLSRSPDFIIDSLGAVLYFILYFVIGYRKEVVKVNLRNSFPNKTEIEISSIARQFYRQLARIFIDGVKSFSISKNELREHLVCENPEVLRKHYDEGKSVIITVGHYSSWEPFLAGINLFIRHRAAVIYQPLSDAFLDRKLREARGDFRTIMIPTKNVKDFFRDHLNEPCAIAFAIDQSPASPTKCYWMEFLNQDTAIHFGAEKYAKEYDLPVYFARITPMDNHRYKLTFELVTATPNREPHGFITEQSTRLLEDQIKKQPELWLWSHKRWKHKRINQHSTPNT